MPVQDEIHAFVGWDARDALAYRVCVESLRRRSSLPVSATPVGMKELQRAGLYRRPTEIRGGRLFDAISDAPMGTAFALARFFAPLMARDRGVVGPWILVCDCDILWRADAAELLAAADPGKALMCVKHDHRPPDDRKLNSEPQTRYGRKNWSSVMLINLDHPSNARLTLEVLNTAGGSDLHALSWLADDEIGGLDEDWNWLEGWSPVRERPPRAIHFTRGGPWDPACRGVQYAELWLAEYGALMIDAPGGGAAAGRR